MAIDLIHGRDIERLNSLELPAVLNALLSAEAGQNRIPLLDLDVTTRHTDPDAGVDARIRWPTGVAHDIFVKGENVLQYKAGKLTPELLRREFNKPGVQRALKNGGAYLICVGNDSVRESTIKLRERLLHKLCRARHYSPKKAKILWKCYCSLGVQVPKCGCSVGAKGEHQTIQNC